MIPAQYKTITPRFSEPKLETPITRVRPDRHPADMIPRLPDIIICVGEISSSSSEESDYNSD